MAVICGFRINRAQQLELPYDVGWFETENFLRCGCYFPVVHDARAECVDADGDGVGIADGVGELDFAALGQAGGDDVFRDITAHVRGAAIDLARILAAERAAAVAAHAAVGIDDNLAAGQATVALRSTDDEAAGRVDENLRVAGQHFLRQNFLDDLPGDEVSDRLVGRIGSVLGGNDHVGDLHRLAVDVLHRNLALGVGAEPLSIAGFA